MGTFMLILFEILNVLMFLWFLTCTEHRSIPLLFVIVDFIMSLLPGLNILFFWINLVWLINSVMNCTVEMKNNWFNRVFLAYNE